MATTSSRAEATARLYVAPVEGAAELFTPAFADYLIRLHDEFATRVRALRDRRAEVLTRALTHGIPPTDPPASEARTGNWRVAPVPDELQRPGIEISGPCSITSMFINALNPGPEGERAEGDLDDDEDSAAHRLVDTVQAARNRLAAVNRELTYVDREKGKRYTIAEGDLPFFMHRERGLHLDEPDVRVDGAAVPAAILGTALTLFYAGRAQAGRGQGIYFYLPKLEAADEARLPRDVPAGRAAAAAARAAILGPAPPLFNAGPPQAGRGQGIYFSPPKLEAADEARLYRDLFDRSRALLPFLGNATIRAIVLVESLPCVYQMEEMLWALGPYAAGLNAARWDLKASIFEYVMADPKAGRPDRFGVDIKATPFPANI